jgi:hypothetical protein
MQLLTQASGDISKILFSHYLALFLRCDAIYFSRYVPTIRRNLPLSVLRRSESQARNKMAVFIEGTAQNYINMLLQNICIKVKKHYSLSLSIKIRD